MHDRELGGADGRTLGQASARLGIAGSMRRFLSLDGHVLDLARTGLVTAFAGFCGACSETPPSQGDATMQSIRVESSAFEQGGTIPPKFTGDGEDLSPALSWSDGPAGTKSYALIVDDPDAPVGTWVHWIAWNLHTTNLEEGAGAASRSASGIAQGTNSWKRVGYGGPQPPSGTHRYFFRVYALDSDLALDSAADRAALDRAMRGHQLASGELMGRYSAK